MKDSKSIPSPTVTDVECQFCEFTGSFRDGAEHRRATQHLLRTVAIGEQRRASPTEPVSSQEPTHLVVKDEGDGVWSTQAWYESEDAADHAAKLLTRHRVEIGTAPEVREAGDVWDEASAIVARLQCDPNFSGHWQNGFSMAQFLAIEALEAAKAAAGSSGSAEWRDEEKNDQG